MYLFILINLNFSKIFIKNHHYSDNTLLSSIVIIFIGKSSINYIYISIEHINTLKKDDEEKIRILLKKLYVEGYEYFRQLYEMTERDKNLKELNFNPNKPLTLNIGDKSGRDRAMP